MIKVFLELRFKQLRYIFKEVNWLYQSVLAVILAMTICGITVLASQRQSSLISLVAHIFLFASFHWFRPDLNFLKAYIEKHKLVCFIEYLVTSIPILIGLIISYQFDYIIIHLLSLFALVNTTSPLGSGAKAAHSLKFISDQYFEWKSWFRRYLYLIIILWVVGMFFSFQMGFGILTILLIGLLMIGCYDQNESLSILTASQQNAKGYFSTRISGMILFSVMLYAPLFLLFCIFHLKSWYLPLILIMVLLSYQYYALTIKYAFYEPQNNTSRNKVLLSLGALVFALPFILPAIWALSIKLHFKAIKTLNTYLHDFN
ncbi:MAG: hypothetical protein ABJH98_14360 [Reichenbachiella sp.]|uniref:hypothetical protein n=1 Tax=Reichenbachiella sp. TaxID=2184521 RepID=UPI0032975F17